jgi:hypothetical protein
MTLRLAGDNLKNFGGFGGTGEMFSGLGGKGHAGAAQQGQLSAIYDDLRKKSPEYGEITRNSLAARGLVNRAGMQAESSIHSQGLAAEGQIKAAKIEADAAKAAASAEAKGSMIGSAFSALGSVGGALAMGALMPSDETIKNTIEELDDALSLLRELRPVSFYYNEEYTLDPHRLHYGFIAQEYQEHMPDATYFDESLGKLCIDTNELIGLLVRSIQQLETRIQRMEAKEALAGVN